MTKESGGSAPKSLSSLWEGVSADLGAECGAIAVWVVLAMLFARLTSCGWAALDYSLANPL